MVIGASEENPAKACAGVSTPVSTNATTPPTTANGAGTRSRSSSRSTTTRTAAVNQASQPTRLLPAGARSPGPYWYDG